jgi:hypothetical protein
MYFDNDLEGQILNFFDFSEVHTRAGWHEKSWP